MSLAQFIRHLPPDSASVRAELGDMADWSMLASNVADLVDLMSYWLNSEYHRWIADPDDPEVKRQVEDRRRRGVRPPPIPLVPPVAARPSSLDQVYRSRFISLTARYGDGSGSDAGLPGVEIRPGVRRVTSDEFDVIMGL